MAAVTAAIAAAFLAGAVALFREHRLQQRRLLVAARVVNAALGVARNAIRVSLDGNNWAMIANAGDRESLTETWDAHKVDLAGHLTWEEWQPVERAARSYLALGLVVRDDSRRDAELALSKIQELLVDARSVLQPYCVQRLSVWGLLKRRTKSRRRAQRA